jgi:2,5-diamino-6-(ribosylamino)-4(3H)-pyrimidinone 5'-phosphate reductase
MSADGKIALPSRRITDISSEEDMVRVHRMRADIGVIIVGVGTILADDPKLYVSPDRVADPPPLLKVVLDSSGRTPADAAFLRSPGPSLVATVERILPSLKERLGGLAEVMAFGDGELVDLAGLLAHLGGRGVEQVMVEGGGEVIWSVFDSGLVDEFSVYVGPLVIGGSGSPTPADGWGARDLSKVAHLEIVETERLGDGLWIRYRVLGRD